MIKRLENQAENQKSIATELRTKLNTLWNRLQVNVTYRERFVSTKFGYDKSIINEVYTIITFDLLLVPYMRFDADPYASTSINI